MYPFASIQSINLYTEGSITTEELEIGLWNAIIQSKETRVPRLIRLVDACVCNEIDGLSEPVMNAILSVLDDTITSQELMNLGEFEVCSTHCVADPLHLCQSQGVDLFSMLKTFGYTLSEYGCTFKPSPVSRLMLARAKAIIADTKLDISRRQLRRLFTLPAPLAPLLPPLEGSADQVRALLFAVYLTTDTSCCLISTNCYSILYSLLVIQAHPTCKVHQKLTYD